MSNDPASLTYLVLLLSVLVFWFFVQNRRQLGKMVQQALAWGLIFAGALAVVALMSFLTELTSNVASTQMLLPIFASLVVSSGNNPLFLMIPATLASSLAFMLPTATPPTEMPEITLMAFWDFFPSR